MRRALLPSLLGLALLAAPHARGADLTGRWQGRIRCTEVDAATGEELRASRDSVLEITSLGEQVHVALGTVSIDGALYRSRAFDRGGAPAVLQTKRRGDGAIVACGSNNDAWLGGAEVGLITYKVNEATGTGSLQLEGQFNRSEGAPSGGSIGTCTGRWKRVSTEDPEVPACPVPPAP